MNETERIENPANRLSVLKLLLPLIGALILFGGCQAVVLWGYHEVAPRLAHWQVQRRAVARAKADVYASYRGNLPDMASRLAEVDLSGCPSDFCDRVHELERQIRARISLQSVLHMEALWFVSHSRFDRESAASDAQLQSAWDAVMSY